MFVKWTECFFWVLSTYNLRDPTCMRFLLFFRNVLVLSGFISKWVRILQIFRLSPYVTTSSNILTDITRPGPILAGNITAKIAGKNLWMIFWAFLTDLITIHFLWWFNCFLAVWYSMIHSERFAVFAGKLPAKHFSKKPRYVLTTYSKSLMLCKKVYN